MKLGSKLSLRRRLALLGCSVGAIVLAVVVLLNLFGDAILNSYGKRKAERAFATAHPGAVLRIGKLDYSVVANRLVAQSVTLGATHATLKVDRIALTGVRWAQVLWGKTTLADVLAQASLDATNLNAVFPEAHYGLHCARLQASVPDSKLIAEATALRTLAGDEAFFAAHEFRTTRFHLVVPECKVLGLAYRELLQGKSYRARAIRFSRPSCDALVNPDKPVDPFETLPLMVHEALAAIRQPLQVDSLSITNGHLTYSETGLPAAAPGVLTFGGVSMFIQGIANRGDAAATIRLRAQGNLMDAGTLKVLMFIPITPQDFSFHYSGSLSAMDLTRLNAFLEIPEHIRITSGRAHETAFEINVTAGQARGRVWGIYENFEIAILDPKTGAETRLDNRVTSFVANLFKFRSSNTPDASDSMKVGNVDYTRKPEEGFLRFAWYALRSGVMDVISY